MDDVLDNICPIYICGSVYRHVSLLVGDCRCFVSMIVQRPSREYISTLVLSLVGLSLTIFMADIKKHKLLCFTATPCFHCRLPFYYELKIAFVVWLLSPYTKGSSVLYRKFVHPTLSSKEKVKSLSFLLLYLPLFPLVPLKERHRGQNVQSRL